MKWTLHSRMLRTAVCVSLLAATTVYMWSATKMFVADWLSTSARPGAIQSAVRLEPGNADYRFQLGATKFDQGDATAAGKDFEAAIALNPHASRYYLALATVHLVNNDPAAQERDLVNAIAVDPTTPDVAWDVSQFELASGKIDEGLHHLRTAIQYDKTKIVPGLQVALRFTNGDVQRVMASALPSGQEYSLGLLRILVINKDLDSARKLWADIRKRGETFAPEQAFNYLDALVAAGDSDGAQQVWEYLSSAGQPLEPYKVVTTGSQANLVVNSSFELPILNGGFDWHYRDVPGVLAEIDNSEFLHGNRSLSLTFSGESSAVADAGVYQVVPVAPSTCYDFSAYAMTTGLEGAGGIKIAAESMSGTLLSLLPELRGTTTWHQVETRFRTTADSHFVRVRMIHEMPMTVIKGKLWLDELNISPVPNNLCDAGAPEVLP